MLANDGKANMRILLKLMPVLAVYLVFFHELLLVKANLCHFSVDKIQMED